MAAHYPNPRRFKVNWNYTVAEAARRGGVHEQTIRNWMRMGLRPIDDTRPALITGHEFFRFLNEQRKARKRPCQPHELYCLRCREPRRPAGDMADFVHTDDGRGYLTAICSGCGGMINRRMSPSALPALRKILNIHEQRRERHITDR